MGCWPQAQSDNTLWSLRVLAQPPQSPTGAWSQPREGVRVELFFHFMAQVLPIGKEK